MTTPDSPMHLEIVQTLSKYYVALLSSESPQYLFEGRLSKDRCDYHVAHSQALSTLFEFNRTSPTKHDYVIYLEEDKNWAAIVVVDNKLCYISKDNEPSNNTVRYNSKTDALTALTNFQKKNPKQKVAKMETKTSYNFFTRIPNQIISEAVQKILFSKGYMWASGVTEVKTYDACEVIRTHLNDNRFSVAYLSEVVNVKELSILEIAALPNYAPPEITVDLGSSTVKVDRASGQIIYRDGFGGEEKLSIAKCKEILGQLFDGLAIGSRPIKLEGTFEVGCMKGTIAGLKALYEEVSKNA